MHNKLQLCATFEGEAQEHLELQQVAFRNLKRIYKENN